MLPKLMKWLRDWNKWYNDLSKDEVSKLASTVSEEIFQEYTMEEKLLGIFTIKLVYKKEVDKGKL